MKRRSAIKEWFHAVLFALVTVIIVRGFFIEAFTIPSPSMEKTLQVGDFILVSKLSYGARIPITPLSVPFAHQTLPFTNSKSYLDWFHFPYLRLPGTSEIKRNDIIVFNYPMETDLPIDHRTHYVKRCIAMPGDTLEIKEGKVFINAFLSIEPEYSQFNYLIKTDKPGLEDSTLKKLNITEGGRISVKGDYMLAMTKANAEILTQMKQVKDVKIYSDKKGSYSDFIFPHNDKFPWNIDFFGPLVIPQKGDSVEINLKNIALYERIITRYEENTLSIIHDSIYINNKPTSHYKFKMNYYFMMGDNRHNSADSRFWGFVPENHIVGKAVYILLSINKEAEGRSKIRWDRCFTKLQ